ncbi:hypothetical protein AAMO2058_001348000, partial [Amorphochlora amoebiformis]
VRENPAKALFRGRLNPLAKTPRIKALPQVRSRRNASKEGKNSKQFRRILPEKSPNSAEKEQNDLKKKLNERRLSDSAVDLCSSAYQPPCSKNPPSEGGGGLPVQEKRAQGGGVPVQEKRAQGGGSSNIPKVPVNTLDKKKKKEKEIEIEEDDCPVQNFNARLAQRELEGIYRRHAPHKLQNVPRLMRKNTGKEWELVGRVRDKYNAH